MTDNEYISALKLLIDSAISVGRDWLWNDSDIMDTLTDENGFGLTYDDFVMAGFKEMADEYFHRYRSDAVCDRKGTAAGV